MSGTLCAVHGLAFRQIPAGVSKKTGKAYTAFMACPERGCREKPEDGVYTAAEAAPNATGASPAMEVKPYIPNPALIEKGADWEKIGAQKNRSNLAAAVLRGKDVDFDLLERVEAWVITGEKPDNINVDNIPL